MDFTIWSCASFLPQTENTVEEARRSDFKNDFKFEFNEINLFWGKILNVEFSIKFGFESPCKFYIYINHFLKNDSEILEHFTFKSVEQAMGSIRKFNWLNSVRRLKSEY